jgi:hypothetical protein
VSYRSESAVQSRDDPGEHIDITEYFWSWICR